MSIKKYSSGQWVDIPYRKYGTETDTLTSLPADVIADGQSASANIIGNMVQTGTPSPSSIIMPDETGDKTANLCDEDNLNQGYYNNTPPFAFNDDNRYRCFSLNLTAGTYSILVYGSNIPMRLMRISSNSLGIGTVSRDNEPYTFDLMVSETVYISFRNTDTSTDFTGLTVMMNAGNTVLPYEPYGQYKIPILSGGTTTNVYLGEVQSTRQIKKYEFTGNESFIYEAAYSRFFMTISDILSIGVRLTPMICNVYECISDGRAITNVPYNSIYSGGGADAKKLFIKTSDYTTEADYKAFLAEKYADGTPVTLWYITEEPTTGIVNEPLRKIGTYADSVAVSNVPTTGTAESFDVDTTLKPSEVDLTYHGWHPVASVHKAVRTTNIYDKYNTIDIPDFGTRYGMYCVQGDYSIYNDTDNNIYWFMGGGTGRYLACSSHSTATVNVSGFTPLGFYMPYNDGSLGDITIVQGTTAPDHYIPYIDWVDG